VSCAEVGVVAVMSMIKVLVMTASKATETAYGLAMLAVVTDVL